MSFIQTVITFISNVSVEYWIYAYFILTVFGYLSIFWQHKWGIFKAFEVYEHTPYFKYAAFGILMTVFFWPLAKLYVKIVQRWVFKVQCREWKKNLSF